MAKFSDNSMSGIVWDDIVITTGALAAATFVSSNSKIDANRLQGFRVLKTEYFGAVRNMTTGQGPLLLCLVHDLSNAEMAETMAGNPQRSHDPSESEKARRPIWPLEVLMPNSDGDGNIVFKGVATIGWSIPEGTALKWAILNMDSGVLTTGPVVAVTAKHFGVWLKD